MRNIHPLFKPTLAPYAPPPVAMIPFAVRINVGGKPQELNILAESSCDAVMRAFELLFPDFDSVKPHGGLKVAVEPVRRTAA